LKEKDRFLQPLFEKRGCTPKNFPIPKKSLKTDFSFQAFLKRFSKISLKKRYFP